MEKVWNMGSSGESDTEWMIFFPWVQALKNMWGNCGSVVITHADLGRTWWKLCTLRLQRIQLGCISAIQVATSQVVYVLLTSRKSEAKKQKKKIKVNQTSDARELIVGIESLQLLPTSSNLALFKTTQDCLTFYRAVSVRCWWHVSRIRWEVWSAISVSNS